MCLDHFQSYLCQKYGFEGPYALKRAIEIITEFEEEQKTVNPFQDDFEIFDDRFNPGNQSKLLELISKHLSKPELSTEFLHESSSYILIKQSI